MQSVYANWQQQKRYTWESKKLYVNPNKTVPGELILHVSNSVDSFFNGEELINTFLLPPYFVTSTLSDAPLSENPNGDAYRLTEFLKKFDDEFYAHVADKTSGEGTLTSDPLFW